MNELNPDQKTRLRESVLRVLARSPMALLAVSAIAFHLKQGQWTDFDFTEEAVREALAVLEGLGFVAQVPNFLGGIVRWKPTSNGIIFYERNLS